MNVLITGGAGFIGSHLARRLLRENCAVVVLDSLSPQVHGKAHLHPEGAVADRILSGTDGSSANLRVIIGDVRDRVTFARALEGQDVVVHLAAETGTAQSMYEVERYEDVNLKGTAILMDYLVNNRNSRVRKMVVASSRAVYGEGKYACGTCGSVYPGTRRVDDMKAGRFEPSCPTCGGTCHSVPTDECSAIHPSSFYGLTKQAQEQMVLLFSRVLGISGFALRYQNVYGPGQSLKNPYTGILAIFSSRARANEPIEIFEDGEETRDFVFVDDVVEATWRCVRPETAGIEAINVGSGQSTSVREVVTAIIDFFDSHSPVAVRGTFREGDIRHNVADITKAQRLLGYQPRWGFRDGVRSFVSSAWKESGSSDAYERSFIELKSKGLMHGYAGPERA